MPSNTFIALVLEVWLRFLCIFAGDADTRSQMQVIIEELQNVKTQTRSTERRASMTQLIRLTREGNSAAVIKEKFRYVQLKIDRP